MFEVIFFSMIPIFITYELLQMISPINFRNTNIFILYTKIYMCWSLVGLYFNFWVSLWLIILSLSLGFYNVYNKTYDTNVQQYIKNKRMFAFWTIVILSYSLYTFFTYRI